MKRFAGAANLQMRKRLTAILVAVVFVFGTAVIPAEIYGTEAAESVEMTETAQPEAQPAEAEEESPAEDAVSMEDVNAAEAVEAQQETPETESEEPVAETEEFPAEEAAEDLTDALDVDLDSLDESEYDGFIYKLEDDVTKTEIREMEQSIGDLDEREGKAVDEVVKDELYAADSIETIAEVAPPEQIEYIEPNYIIKAMGTNDPSYAQHGWYLDMIHAPYVWEKGEFGDEVTIAVLDSGVKANHEDFDNTFFTNGYNAISGTQNVRDNSGHGTAITGIIAASQNNNKGLTGVMPQATIMPVKVMEYDLQNDETAGSADSMIRGMNYAVDHGAEVINISAGSDENIKSLKAACQNAADKGVIIVASAGNDGSSIAEYPASYDTVIGVGSVEKDGAHSDFSNYNQSVAVTAPGRGIRTPWRDGGYVSYTGTSFSAPQVAAMAAMIKRLDPSINNKSFMSILSATCVDKGAKGYDPYYGYGIMDLEKAYRHMTENDVSALDVSLSATAFTYDGKVKTPAVTVKRAGKALSSDCYKTSYAAGRKTIGTYKVTVEGRNGYTGTKTLTFKINGVGDMSACQVSLSSTAFSYDGKAKKPAVAVKKAGKTLSSNYYKTKYAAGRTAVGTYKVTVEGVNGLLGTKTLSFKVIPPLVKSINAPKQGKKQLTVCWKAMDKSQQKKYKTAITGYQVRVSTNKQFTDAKYASIKGIDKTQKVVKGLKKKTTYYVQYRSYKTVGSATYHSKWSGIKKAKTE